MTTEFTEENFTILFNEEQNVIELRYQGVNAAVLEALSNQIVSYQNGVDGELLDMSGLIATLTTNMSGTQALAIATSNDLAAEQAARILADTNSTNALLAAQDSLAASIQDEVDARAAALLAEAAARGVAIADATGGIVTDVAALASTVSGIAVDLGMAEANVITVQEALATETAARAAQYSSIAADLSENSAAILSESLARVTDTDALAIQIDALSAATGTTVFTQDDEPTTGMSAGDVWYDTNDGNHPYRYNGTAWVDVSDIRIVNNAAAIVAETLARTDADTAEALARTTLAARVTVNEGDIADNSAAITSESVTRAGETSALASNISSLTATVGDHTASISTQQTVIDGLTANFQIKLDVNGYISGFGAYNDGATSDFIVLADKFQIVTPGATPLVPFSVIDGVVYANDLVVKNANIENLTVSKLTAGDLTAPVTQNADWSVGTGKIVFDSNPGSAGGYVKITGIGFGPSSSYLEWFGPKPGSYTSISDIVANLSDASAIQYLKTNGDAYFGGSLSAGVLKNSVLGTSLSATAQTVLGPFGTNGGPKTVVVSYSAYDLSGGLTTGPASGSNSATIQIYRNLPGSSTLVATLSPTGTWTVAEPDAETGVGGGASTLSGSVTFTDTNTSTDDFTYTATITARSMTYWGSLQYQRLSIISTEE